MRADKGTSAAPGFFRLSIEFLFEFARFGRQLDAQFLQCTRKITVLAVPCAVGRRLRNSAKIFDNVLDHPAKPQLAHEPRTVDIEVLHDPEHPSVLVLPRIETSPLP